MLCASALAVCLARSLSLATNTVTLRPAPKSAPSASTWANTVLKPLTICAPGTALAISSAAEVL